MPDYIPHNLHILFEEIKQRSTINSHQNHIYQFVQITHWSLVDLKLLLEYFKHAFKDVSPVVFKREATIVPKHIIPVRISEGEKELAYSEWEVDNSILLFLVLGNKGGGVWVEEKHAVD